MFQGFLVRIWTLETSKTGLLQNSSGRWAVVPSKVDPALEMTEETSIIATFHDRENPHEISPLFHCLLMNATLK